MHGVIVTKKQSPEKGFGSPHTPWNNPTQASGPSKASANDLLPSPSPAEQITQFSARCADLPPALSLQCPALVLQPSPTRLGRDGWKKGLHFHVCSGPRSGAWLAGAGEAPQLPASDAPTPLPTWAALGLKGASDTQATNVGLLACSLAPMVAELISHLSVLGAEDEDGWAPY